MLWSLALSQAGTLVLQQASEFMDLGTPRTRSESGTSNLTCAKHASYYVSTNSPNMVPSTIKPKPSPVLDSTPRPPDGHDLCAPPYNPFCHEMRAPRRHSSPQGTSCFSYFFPPVTASPTTVCPQLSA
ncbi:hypothetical protein BOTBODRAFT_478914 [Botryobasidium botryosum FD-172 SS1]|uniref:Uncharacterized protein n=1 Tax=Botryobasidium botryosum (strain FD-172 SS1) TaxID=930990 RepID=A0A067MTK9_BOTB1|nr:hypothetical protein BOTBODRAFT_478914 [Botryobasidium botryosum FD-172 SS1]